MCLNNIFYLVSDIIDLFVRLWLFKIEDIELIEKLIDVCSWFYIFYFE